jgi:hypothetical protein
MTNAHDPPKSEGRLRTGQRNITTQSTADYTSERGLQIAAITAHAVVELNSKLDDLLVLLQQSTDLLRRIVNQEVER